MKVTALLPMKGNSVRVPNKNIRLIAGLPLYSYVLKKLVSTPFINQIIVNTDSEVIANEVLSRFPGVKINKRKESLIGDDVPMNSIIGSDLEIASNDLILQTHSTNPLLSVETLERAYRTYLDSSVSYDSLFSVNKFQSRFYDANFKPLNHDPKVLLKTQDLPPLYEENSLFYFFTKESFNKHGMRIGEKPYPFATPKFESIDIDTEEDFSLAEKLILTRI